jgi:hypothetical protein
MLTPGTIMRVYIIKCASCDRIVTWTGGHYPSRRDSEAGFREAGWSRTSARGWLCPDCNPRKPSPQQLELPLIFIEEIS